MRDADRRAAADPGRPRRWAPRAALLTAALAAVVLAGAVGGLLLWPGSDRAATADAAAARTSPPGSSAGAASPLVGGPAPALAGVTLAGGRLDLAALRGSVVVVTVWAAWCAPCRAELPVLVDAERRLGPRGLRLVGIDHRDGERQARALLAQVGGDPASSVADPDGRLADGWRVAAVPQTFVVDAAGVVRAARLGPVTADWLYRTTAPLLAARSPAAGGG